MQFNPNPRVNTMAKKAQNKKPKKFVEELPCKLSTVEYEKTAEQLTQQMDAATLLEEQKTLAMQDFKERILLAERALATLKEAVASHAIKWQVECIEEVDFDRNRARVVRLDTGEVVRERALSGDERAQLAQGELPVLEDDAVLPELRT